MRNTIHTGRDPYARQDIRKTSVPGTCRFCGSQNRYGKVWQYHVEPDAGRPFDIPGQFCSIDCLNSYHGATK